MNKRDFEKFRQTLIEEFENTDYVSSLELLVCLQQQTIGNMINEMGDRYVQSS